MTNQETNVTNYYESDLASTLSSGSTSASVTSASGSPSAPFYMVVDADDSSNFWVALVTAKSGTTFTLDSAAPRTFSAGTEVGCYPVADLWTDINDRVEAHTHSGGTDGTAIATGDLTGHDKAAHDALTLDHGSLSGLADFTADHGADHDTHDHSTALGTASLADLGTANGSDLDDLGTFMANVEARGSTEVATYTTSGAAAWEDAATVNLTIPAGWGGWDIDAFATALRTTTAALDLRISIDNVGQQEHPNTPEQVIVIGGSASGSSTGTVAVSLQVRDAGGGPTDIPDIYLHARAVRTS